MSDDAKSLAPSRRQFLTGAGGGRSRGGGGRARPRRPHPIR